MLQPVVGSVCLRARTLAYLACCGCGHRKPVQACSRGDRLGICVTQLDAKQVERGLACAPGLDGRA